MAIVSANGAAVAQSPNYIINGAFDINQRAFTSVTTNGAFGFDRWKNSVGSGGGTNTLTPQTFSPGSSSLFGFEATNYLRITSTSQSTANDWAGIQTSLEDVRTLAGQTATLSFWAKASAGTPVLAATIEQSFGTGGSATARVNSSNIQLNTSWTRYSVTIANPSISGKTIGANNALNIFLFTSMGSTLVGSGYPNVGLQNTTVDFFGLQLEAGSVATPFRRNAPSIQAELAACERYFQRYVSADNGLMFSGYTASSTAVSSAFTLRTTMRTAPSSVAFANLKMYDFSTAPGISAITLNVPTQSFASLNITSSGLVAGRMAYVVGSNGVAGYLDLNAEL